MTLRAKGARKRRGSSPRRKEEGTVKVCPEAGRERRLMYGHLGAPARAAVHRERRAPAAGSRAFIKDAGRRFAAIPHIRPGHADLAARGTCPADPRRALTSREGSAMVERFVGIDVALREHRIGVDPVSWTPHGWGGKERPRCRRAIGRTRRSSGSGSSSWS